MDHWTIKQIKAVDHLRAALTRAEKAGFSLFAYSGGPGGSLGVCLTTVWEKEVALDYTRRDTDLGVLPISDAFKRMANEMDQLYDVNNNVEIFGL